MPGQLTTTSYAILGLLAIKPFTTYEIAQQMDRALGLFWARARSKIYEEPKKLVALGLAKSTRETVGQRPRTVYKITANGRKALAAWVPEPGGPPAMEFEQLVKLFFAEHGSRDDVIAGLRASRAWAVAEQDDGIALCRGYLDGEGPFPDRLPWILLVGNFLHRFEQMVAEWSTWAESVVESWPDDVRDAPRDLDTLAKMVDEMEDLVRTNGGTSR